MPKCTVRDIDLAGKRVLVRVDFNVPMDKASGAITDDRRIRAALPTLEYLRDQGARIVLLSHLGRPDGAVRENLRLGPVAARLQELAGGQVGYVPALVGAEVDAAVANLKPGEVLLLENTRFDPREEDNGDDLASGLAALGDVFVNDAFGTAHRAHASTEGIAHHRPAVAGFLMEKELAMLDRCLADPEHPFVAIVGGAKISSKIIVLERLLERADTVVIGGGMACTFLRAQGLGTGTSLVEEDQVAVAAGILERAERDGRRILLPVDAVVADRFAADARTQVVPADAIPDGWQMLDVGPRTVEAIKAVLEPARTVLWNGPLGVFEFPAFAEGTLEVAQVMAGLEAVTVVGGGETAAAVEAAGVADRIDHVSTGGGATLEYIEGRVLPGVAALKDC